MHHAINSVRAGSHRVMMQGKFTLGPSLHYVLSFFTILTFVQILILQRVVSNSVILTILFLAIAFSQSSLFIATAFTEPGIIPPRPADTASASEVKPSPVGSIVNGISIESKWCFACNVYTPPRGKHCQYCRCCIERFDHHCKFLSNCIGSRNHRNFVLLIANSFVMALFVLVVMLFRAVFHDWKDWLLFLISVTTGVLTGYLVVYHGKLILKNSTSYETLKGFAIADEEELLESSPLSRLSNASPFSLGNWQTNLNAFMTSQVDPSKFRLTEKKSASRFPKAQLQGKPSSSSSSLGDEPT